MDDTYPYQSEAGAAFVFVLKTWRSMSGSRTHNDSLNLPFLFFPDVSLFLYILFSMVFPWPF